MKATKLQSNYYYCVDSCGRPIEGLSLCAHNIVDAKKIAAERWGVGKSGRHHHASVKRGYCYGLRGIQPA
jgi:hypothetical protein